MAVVDNFLRRQWDFELAAQTLTPIQPLTDRLRVWQELTFQTHITQDRQQYDVGRDGRFFALLYVLFVVAF